MQEADINLTCSLDLKQLSFFFKKGEDNVMKPVLWSELGFPLPAGSPSFPWLEDFIEALVQQDPVLGHRGVGVRVLISRAGKGRHGVGNDAVWSAPASGFQIHKRGVLGKAPL